MVALVARVEWLDHLLGRDRLVRRAGSFCLVSVGLVGTGPRARSSRGRLAICWPAPFVYLLITGGFPYTVLMLAVLTVWLAVRALVSARIGGAVRMRLAGR